MKIVTEEELKEIGMYFEVAKACKPLAAQVVDLLLDYGEELGRIGEGLRSYMVQNKIKTFKELREGA